MNIDSRSRSLLECRLEVVMKELCWNISTALSQGRLNMLIRLDDNLSAWLAVSTAFCFYSIKMFCMLKHSIQELNTTLTESLRITQVHIIYTINSKMNRLMMNSIYPYKPHLPGECTSWSDFCELEWKKQIIREAFNIFYDVLNMSECLGGGIYQGTSRIYL